MAVGRADSQRLSAATSTSAFAASTGSSRASPCGGTSGAQVEQMLTSGEVDMIADLGFARAGGAGDGAPVEIVWDQGIWGVDNWSILAGTPNADACREFIKFASDPKRMAALTEYFPAGVTQPDAFKYIKPEIAKNCPTPSRQHQERRADRRQILARQPGGGDRAVQCLDPEVSAPERPRWRQPSLRDRRTRQALRRVRRARAHRPRRRARASS